MMMYSSASTLKYPPVLPLQVIPNLALTSKDIKEGDNTYTSVAGTPLVVRNM
jgi:hypothetical protein